VVRKGVLDYSMSQITQIVKAIMESFWVYSYQSQALILTLKITLGAMNEIIQTFRRYNYEIISEHQEDNYINNLKERSDYLDKYLNI
jgi:hypothetical protein